MRLFSGTSLFTDADLYDPEGKRVMLLGLDVLPEYRGQGLAGELVRRYVARERKRAEKDCCLPVWNQR